MLASQQYPTIKSTFSVASQSKPVEMFPVDRDMNDQDRVSFNTNIRCNGSNGFNHSIIQQPKPIDVLPGNYEMDHDEQVRFFVDGVNLFEEKYQIAKSFDPESPMIKLNASGMPAIALFSHDMVKQWQKYELQGKTKRPLPQNFSKLLGKFLASLTGPTHSEWRKKAAKAFKPHIIDQYTPFIQKAATDIVLQGLANKCEESGESIYFCQEAKKFAFQIGIKFVCGPLISEPERAEIFPVC